MSSHLEPHTHILAIGNDLAWVHKYVYTFVNRYVYMYIFMRHPHVEGMKLPLDV